MKTINYILTGLCLFSSSLLIGCQGTGGGASGGVASLSIPATPFTKTASKETLAIQTAGGLVGSDLANGMMSVGDTANEPKRALITFSTSGLLNEVASAHVSLFFDSHGASDEIANLGTLQICRIQGTANPTASDYNSAEIGCVSIFTSQSQYSAIAQGTEVVADVSDLLQDAIQESDPYFTVKIRFTNASGGGNNGLNFYGFYQSEVLANRIATLSGATR